MCDLLFHNYLNLHHGCLFYMQQTNNKVQDNIIWTFQKQLSIPTLTLCSPLVVMFTLRTNNIDSLGAIFLAQMKELIYSRYTVIHYEDEGLSLTQCGMGHCTKIRPGVCGWVCTMLSHSWLATGDTPSDSFIRVISVERTSNVPETAYLLHAWELPLLPVTRLLCELHTIIKI